MSSRFSESERPCLKNKMGGVIEQNVRCQSPTATCTCVHVPTQANIDVPVHACTHTLSHQLYITVIKWLAPVDCLLIFLWGDS